MSVSDRLDVHFLNVDHGDCTIVVHPETNNDKNGRVTIVDINDWKDRKIDSYQESLAGLNPFEDLKKGYLRANEFEEKYISPEEYANRYLNDPIEYYQSMYPGRDYRVWRFILTHPDLDHISGLDRLVDEVDFSVFWDTNNNKTLNTSSDFGPRFSVKDWEAYQKIRNKKTDLNVISPKRGQSKQFWDDDNMEILHPTESFEQIVNENNEDRSDESQVFNDISYVIKIKIGNQAVLLCGDVMEQAWTHIIEHKGLEYFNDITVLKASHHGRKSGFHRELVESMDPDYVILSVGTKPHTDAHQQYKDACGDDTEVLSTRQYGRLRARCTRRRCTVDRDVPDGIF